MFTVEEIRNFIKDLPGETAVGVELVDGEPFLMGDSRGITIYATVTPCENPHCNRSAHAGESCDDGAECKSCDYCIARQRKIPELAGETIG